VITFVGHGPPTLALDAQKGRELRAIVEDDPVPSAALVISAHFARDEPTLGTTTTLPLVYDFSGFPAQLLNVRYPAPGAPALAEEVRAALRNACTLHEAPERGLDHGVWTPLVHMLPGAKVPVLELSLAFADEPRRLLDVGRALAAVPSIANGETLVLASGNLVHNLRTLDWNQRPSAPGWAMEFDSFTEEALTNGDLDALAAFRDQPSARLAHPTTEHFLPVLVVAALAEELGQLASFPITGFELGSIGRRCVKWCL
jgi:4,5-DOPA dioxygenase extradiol